MRAYISHPAADRADSIIFVSAPVLAHVAEQEARRILAETEPPTALNTSPDWIALDMTWERLQGIYRGGDVTVGMILAESLAAFVSMEGL